MLPGLLVEADAMVGFRRLLHIYIYICEENGEACLVCRQKS